MRDGKLFYGVGSSKVLTAFPLTPHLLSLAPSMLPWIPVVRHGRG